MISFEYECWALGDVKVHADVFGKHLQIISHETGGTIKPSRLREIDYLGILATVKEWVDHYADMKRKAESWAERLRPENDAFGKEYVEGLKQDMNKEK